MQLILSSRRSCVDEWFVAPNTPVAGKPLGAVVVLTLSGNKTPCLDEERFRRSRNEPRQ
jgi:hypothetical protein